MPSNPSKASPQHPCAICSTPVGAGFLMCRPHWRLVPLGEQRAVYRTWDRFLAGGRLKPDVREAYFAARDRAVESVRAAMSTSTGESNDQ